MTDSGDQKLEFTEYMTTEELNKRASKIKMIILDVDGVMTDGRVYISADGVESKSFDIRDGFAVVFAKRHGLKFGIISGLKSPIVDRRAAQLGIEEVHAGFHDKKTELEDILRKHNLKEEQVAYMGDDLLDLPVIRRVGLSAAPADSRPEVIEKVHWVSNYPGGRGAVRELIELVMKSQGTWESLWCSYAED